MMHQVKDYVLLTQKYYLFKVREGKTSIYACGSAVAVIGVATPFRQVYQVT